MFRLGVDLGGTKVEVAVIDAEGKVRLRRREPAPRAGYEAGLAALARIVEEAEREAGAPCRVGIGIPGFVEPASGILRNAHATAFNDRALRPDLGALLNREVRFANDANCFALSEAIDGAGRDARVVFGVILGTGAGAGLVVDGRILSGANGIAGEWGHNSLPWPGEDERPGPACYCGRSGCIERFVSGPALADHHLQETGERLDAMAIVSRAGAGDAGCERSLAKLEERLARALAMVVNLVDPDIFVFGGGLSNVGRIPANALRQAGNWVYGGRFATRHALAQHGDSSGVLGAARLWEAPD